LIAKPCSTLELGEEEIPFIEARDSFSIATVNENGWPYIQHRGGPVGFLSVLDSPTLGFAEFRGNRQLQTTGDVSVHDKIALFLMDYDNRERLQISGTRGGARSR
jgi:predicted pyridoxine 5'-phosphate oxidase superfamily flavin-nucleotide-binding protein